MKTNYKMFDNNTFATETGEITLSDKKLKVLRPSLHDLGAIPETEWERATEMGNAYLKRYPNVARDGRPVFSSIPEKV